MAEIQLGAVEARFADIIWEREPVTSAELIKLAAAKLTWKRTTTHTVLRRLCDKGLFQNHNGVGIDVEKFQNLPGKQEEDKGCINIGAVVRVTPIKDIMTMIQAFGFAKEVEPSLKLWIMGPCEEEDEYAKDCYELVRVMGISDVIFTGRVDVTEYYGRMDIMLLTSISEGQPLTILESFAARKPVVATDVGNCRGLILGENDDYGEAGIVVRIMHVEEIARAILTLAHDENTRLRMGENGYQRVVSGYRFSYFQDTYRNIYKRLIEEKEQDEVEDGGMKAWQA